ncbi:MAG: DNA gyrase C-terminal beta-propeller domain-containing protein, partial [Pseudomonadales bacterium]
SSAGYGFLCRLGDLVGKQKAGKAVLTLPQGALVLPPQRVEDPESNLLVAVSSAGRMLVFPVSELPALARGKGNKILSIPKASVVSGEEVLRGVVALPADGVLRVHAGARYLNMKTSDLDAYRGERARRGQRLPRGFQRVDRIERV